MADQVHDERVEIVGQATDGGGEPLLAELGDVVRVLF